MYFVKIKEPAALKTKAVRSPEFSEQVFLFSKGDVDFRNRFSGDSAFLFTFFGQEKRKSPYTRLERAYSLKKLVLRLGFLFSITLFVTPIKAQDSLQTKGNIKKYALFSAGTIVATDVLLYQAWYKNYSTGSFHFFNDQKEWLQMDKIGHGFSAYQAQRGYHRFLIKQGLDQEPSLILSAFGSTLFLLSIEVLDGFSSGWGASWGDLIANTAGVSLFSTQQWLWKEQKIHLKWSYSPSPYSKLRPEVLGANALESILKDYNGQTYWLSTPVSTVLKHQNIPPWLCLSIGYGADGLLGGSDNPVFNKQGDLLPAFKRQRQYYLSLDVDLQRIKSKHAVLNKIFFAFNTLKIPFPALRWQNGVWYVDPLGF